MAILDFLVSGWHGFGSVTQVCFGISVSNFMCMSFVAVDRSLTIVSYVAFKMAALWFWTMFNCNPPIAHRHPLLWGGGILVDHWSTISSWCWCKYYRFCKVYFSTNDQDDKFLVSTVHSKNYSICDLTYFISYPSVLHFCPSACEATLKDVGNCIAQIHKKL